MKKGGISFLEIYANSQAERLDDKLRNAAFLEEKSASSLQNNLKSVRNSMPAPCALRAHIVCGVGRHKGAEIKGHRAGWVSRSQPD